MLSKLLLNHDLKTENMALELFGPLAPYLMKTDK